MDDNNIRNISDSEQELAERNEELEAQHEELTAAVEALISKNQLLEKTIAELNTRNKEIDQIVYRSYHDLKTPISAIEGLLMLIENDPASTPEYLSHSKKTIESMKYTLKMLRRYSSNLVNEINHQPVDFELMWSHIKNELLNGKEMKSVKVNHKFPTQPVMQDFMRIKLILFNLIKNSIDYRRGRCIIDIDISVKDDALKIVVSDNGVGIERGAQNNVFDMFYRGSSQSTGAGLGLYLTKRVTEMLHGNITLVSTVNIGTTVKVILPLTKE